MIDTPVKESDRPVKIAILDTGFDQHDPFLRGAEDRIIKTKSWISGDDAVIGSSMRDESGRGTHAMALLLRMAPQANVYAAKIAKNSLLTEEVIPAVTDVCCPSHPASPHF